MVDYHTGFIFRIENGDENDMIKKAVVEDRLIDVITHEEYHRSPSLYQPGYCAVEHNGMLYPVRKQYDGRPGYYPRDVVSFFKNPEPSEMSMYTSDDKVIDFSNVSNIKEAVEAHDRLHSAEAAMLTNVETIFEPTLLDSDSPEMRALKEAVISKQIDINKYEHRFGEKFNNDKRLFKKGDITLMKLRSIASALDIKATLILEDASADVPNPMGKVIVTEITSPENNPANEED